jgi:hypothetical protein
VGADTGEKFSFDFVNGQTVHHGKCRVGGRWLKVEGGGGKTFWLL